MLKNGWYRITRSNGEELVEKMQGGKTKVGSVLSLHRENCTFEQVLVLSAPELEKIITEAFQSGAAALKQMVKRVED